jgi:signal transduction histidine kinase
LPLILKFFIKIFFFLFFVNLSFGREKNLEVDSSFNEIQRNLNSSSRITAILLGIDSIRPIMGLPLILEKINNCKNELSCNDKANFTLGLAAYLDTRNLRDSALTTLNLLLNITDFNDCDLIIQLRVKEQIAQRYLRNKEYSKGLKILNNLNLNVLDSATLEITRKLNIYRISILFEMDEIEEALKWAKKMQASLESKSNPYFLFANYKDLAVMYMRLNQQDSAIYWLNQQQKLLTKVDRNLAHHYYNTRGLVEKRVGNFSSAHTNFDSAIVISKQLGLIQNIKSPLVNKANTYLKQQNATACIETLNEVLKYFPFDENKLDLKAAYENLVDAHLLMNDYESAYKENLKLEEINLAIYKNLYDNEVNAQLNQLERKTRENEALLLQNKLFIQEATLLNEKIKNQYFFGIILFFGFLLTSSIIYLYYKNQKFKIKLKQEQEFIDSRLKTQQLNFENEQLKALDTQRAKIGAELHDSIGNLILLHSQGNSNLSLEEVYQTIRNYAHQLNNITLKHFGLYTALEELKEILEKSNRIKLKITNHDNSKKLSQEIQYNIYQIIQELISNAIKHGKATILEVIISYHDSKWVIKVLDNGSKIKEIDKVGLGIESLYSRLNIISANLKRYRIKNFNYSEITHIKN